MSENNAEIDEKHLPPLVQQLIGQLNVDRKKIMREDAFKDPDQLRKFVGTYLYPRLIAVAKLFGAATADIYNYAASNHNEIRRLHAFVVEELELDENAPLPGMNADVLDEIQQALFGIGNHLQEKYPDDAVAKERYNAAVKVVQDLMDELLGNATDEEREGEEEDDEGDDESEEPEEAEPQEPVQAPPEVEG